MAADARPLAGRRIVITRAPEQTEEIVRRLNELGAQVVLLPMVRFAAPEDNAELDRAIASLGEFDWLIFTSANAVSFFLARCCELDQWALLARPSIAVVGSATLATLEAAKLHAALVPAEFSGAALAAELAPRVAGKRVLVPRSDRAGDELPKALRAAGARVREVVAYRTTEPELIDDAMLDSLRQGSADAIAFFSPSAFHNFANILARLGEADALQALSKRLTFAAVGPTTAAAIRDAGVPVLIEASTATAEGLAQALARHLAQDKAETRRIG